LKVERERQVQAKCSSTIVEMSLEVRSMARARCFSKIIMPSLQLSWHIICMGGS